MMKLYQKNPAVFLAIAGIVVAILISWFFWWLAIRRPQRISDEDINKIAEKVVEKEKLFINGYRVMPPTDPRKKILNYGILAMNKKEWNDAIDIFRVVAIG